MLVCRLAALRHRARLVFDWHNFAYTLMAIGMGRGHPVVRLAEKYERHWGPSADASLCVTRAMQVCDFVCCQLFACLFACLFAPGLHNRMAGAARKWQLSGCSCRFGLALHQQQPLLAC